MNILFGLFQPVGTVLFGNFFIVFLHWIEEKKKKKGMKKGDLCNTLAT